MGPNPLAFTRHYNDYDLFLTCLEQENRVSDDDTDSESQRVNRKRAGSPIGVIDEERPNKKLHQDFHRDFVAAIYEVGVANASPSVILENMKSVSESSGVTSERVKSHLQKYRKNRSKGKEEFLAAYDDWMRKALHLQSEKQDGVSRLASPQALLEMMSPEKLMSGEMAAFLSYSVMADGTQASTMAFSEREGECVHEDKSADEFVDYLSDGVPLSFPDLSEEEMNSSLGRTMLYVMDMFYLMKDQLEAGRESQKGRVVSSSRSSFQVRSDLDVVVSQQMKGAESETGTSAVDGCHQTSAGCISPSPLLVPNSNPTPTLAEESQWQYNYPMPARPSYATPSVVMRGVTPPGPSAYNSHMYFPTPVRHMMHPSHPLAASGPPSYRRHIPHRQPMYPPPHHH